MKKHVLLLDFDMHGGTLGMIINKDLSKTIYHLTDDLLNNRYKKLTDYIYNYNEFIDVLPSPKDPRQGNKITSKYINIILDKVKREYDIIIIDTGSQMDEINVVTMDMVDTNLFMINNDLFTLRNTRNILNIFNDIEKTNYKVLLNDSSSYINTYFSINDIKKIIGSSIDYHITKESFIKDITSYLYDNKIPYILPIFQKKCKYDYNAMKLIIKDLEGGM